MFRSIRIIADTSGLYSRADFSSGRLCRLALVVHKHYDFHHQIPSPSTDHFRDLHRRLSHAQPGHVAVDPPAQLCNTATSPTRLAPQLTEVGMTPSLQLTFIGRHLCTDVGLLQVPLDRWRKIQSLIPPVLKEPLFLRQWQSLLGLLSSAQDLTYRDRLQLRPLQRFLYPKK